VERELDVLQEARVEREVLRIRQRTGILGVLGYGCRALFSHRLESFNLRFDLLLGCLVRLIGEDRVGRRKGASQRSVDEQQNHNEYRYR
jgi:hypothetical protein